MANDCLVSYSVQFAFCASNFTCQSPRIAIPCMQVCPSIRNPPHSFPPIFRCVLGDSALTNKGSQYWCRSWLLFSALSFSTHIAETNPLPFTSSPHSCQDDDGGAAAAATKATEHLLSLLQLSADEADQLAQLAAALSQQPPASSPQQIVGDAAPAGVCCCLPARSILWCSFYLFGVHAGIACQLTDLRTPLTFLIR